MDSLKNEKLNESDFKKEILLVNFFASWCVPCIVEHDFLFELKKQKPIKIYGINYKDDIKNLEIWLEKLGNPYSKIGIDKTGITGINWGVNGIPESFLIDKNGIIKNIIKKIAYTKDTRIQIAVSENSSTISPSLSVIEKFRSSLCKISLIIPCE